MEDHTDNNSLDELKNYLELYLRRGFTVIPAIYGTKRPSIKWKEFQEKRPSKKLVLSWFNRTNPQNVAIICGKASGNLVVLDFDDPEVYHKFWKAQKIEQETLVAKTGSGKYHVYLKSKKQTHSFTVPQLKLEIKSDGNIVIAPPSKHPGGGTYCFINKTNSIMVIDDFEDWIWNKAQKLGITRPADLFSRERETRNGSPYRGNDPPCIEKMLEGVEEGTRNNATIRLASYFLHFKQLPIEKVRKLVSVWNMKNKPPLPEKETSDVIKSAQ